MDLHLGYAAGCIGRIVQLRADYYTQAVGFGREFGLPLRIADRSGARMSTSSASCAQCVTPGREDRLGSIRATLAPKDVETIEMLDAYAVAPCEGERRLPIAAVGFPA
jgi:hypothetical protein